MKHLLTSIVALIFFTYGTIAQEIIPKVKRISSNTSAVSQTATILFKANRDFYLTIDNRSYGRVSGAGGRRVSLSVGQHRVRFEEAESTGEYFVHTVNVLPETARRNQVYPVTFRQNF